ncbi:MAG: PRA1 family protein [Lachnospiraceae bacterium]|nr:PRA1 family protein [Lachnospiraceae bacterium]
MDFPLYGQTVTIDEDVIKYGEYYYATVAACNKMMDRFTRKLESSKREITGSNYANILGIMASDFMAIFSGMFDAMWDYIKSTGLKNPGREKVRDAVEALWMLEVKKLYDRQVYPVPHLVFQGFSGEGDSDALLKEAFSWVRGMDRGTLAELPKQISRVALAFPAAAAKEINRLVRGALNRNDYDLLAYQGAIRRYNSVGIASANVSEYAKEMATNGPFDYEGYVLLLKALGDEKGEIKAIVNALGYSDKYESMQLSLINDYIQSLNLNKEYIGYSVAQLEEYQRLIKLRADEICYTGVLKAYNDIEKRLKDIRKTEEMARAKRLAIEEAENEEEAFKNSEVNKAFERLSKAAEEEKNNPKPEEKKPEPKRKPYHEPTDYEIQSELELIKSGIKGQDIIGRYRYVESVKDHEWQSEEAKRAIRKLEASIPRDREKLVQRVKDAAMYKYIKYAVLAGGGILSVIALVASPLFGVMALLLTVGLYFVIDIFARDGVVAANKLRRLDEAMNAANANEENS